MSIKRETVAERKALPLASGVLDYFPDALLVVAEVSRVGNEQHHPGEPLHWDKSKSTDEADALLRHLMDRGTIDTDGLRHSGKVAWRALAMLQRELDAEVAVEPVFVPDPNMQYGTFGQTRELTVGDGSIYGRILPGETLAQAIDRTLNVSEEPWGTGDGPIYEPPNPEWKPWASAAGDVYGMPRDAWVHGPTAPFTGRRCTCYNAQVYGHLINCDFYDGFDPE